MPGPLHLPRVLVLYPFRYRHELTGKWVKARYVAERHVIAERYAEWEIVGPPELRGSVGGHFSPWRGVSAVTSEQTEGVDTSPALRDDERPLVLLFLRRYVAYCARRRRFAAMEGAARLYRSVGRSASPHVHESG
jgi:hypothetical protein